MITDPVFYAVAVPAIFIIGLSKGGFTGMGAISVPMMAMVAEPLQVAAVLVPILVTLDVVAVWNYRHSFDRMTLIITVPASLIGVAAGWALAARVDPDWLRLMIGLVGIAFTLSVWLAPKERAERGHSVVRGTFWSALSAFTSFVALSGAPPYQMYLLPLKLPHRIYAGTFTMFMAVGNVLKIGPFIMLGQFNTGSLKTSGILFPIALVATFIGIWAVKRVSNTLFYRAIHLILFAVSLKLIYSSTRAIFFG